MFLLNIGKEGGGGQFLKRIFNALMILSLNQKTFSIQHFQFSFLINVKTHLSPELSMIQLIGIIMKIQTTRKKLLAGQS